ncbi:DUF3267 domain-containing protein [Mobilitalea sibirica]|uniref:DUF3267 domain-containing protein n=1 Tax=Mobilitalea sibirica TaxID=1462919 RepID=A0A8J7H111_9FIRM|nr:DUF3267 domain-containing protein [Mobilitalea sibirica]MBH1939660.1 DUF3267 domain-containing protein [Mobilitalea sibirica]
MKLVWKGKFTNISQLSKVELPENAVKFKEPGNLGMVNIVAILYAIPVCIILSLIVNVKVGDEGFHIGYISPLGIWLSFLAIVPHELLHAVMFTKDSTVEFWYSIKSLIAFVFSSSPMSKRRFIIMSLFPNIILGLVPFIVWLMLPDITTLGSRLLLSFSVMNLLAGAGDYMNVINAAIQMPKEAITRLSGFHSYWYLP